MNRAVSVRFVGLLLLGLAAGLAAMALHRPALAVIAAAASIYAADDGSMVVRSAVMPDTPATSRQDR